MAMYHYVPTSGQGDVYWYNNKISIKLVYDKSW